MSFDILSGISSDILSRILSGILFDILYGLFLAIAVRLKSGEAYGAPNLVGWSPASPTASRISPVEVRRGPQRSDPRRLKPAIKSWQMESGEAHCDQELADEIRRGSLRSRAGRWGPARKKEEEGRRKEDPHHQHKI